MALSTAEVGEDTAFYNPSYFTRNDTLLLFLSQVKTLGFLGLLRKNDSNKVYKNRVIMSDISSIRGGFFYA